MEKQCVTYSMCVSVVLDVQHAKRMRRITLTSIVRPVLKCFSTLPYKRHDFRTGRTIDVNVMRRKRFAC